MVDTQRHAFLIFLKRSEAHETNRNHARTALNLIDIETQRNQPMAARKIIIIIRRFCFEFDGNRVFMTRAQQETIIIIIISFQHKNFCRLSPSLIFTRVNDER